MRGGLQVDIRHWVCPDREATLGTGFIIGFTFAGMEMTRLSVWHTGLKYPRSILARLLINNHRRRQSSGTTSVRLCGILA